MPIGRIVGALALCAASLGCAADAEVVDGSDATGLALAETAAFEDLGQGDGSDVVLLGDTWMSLPTLNQSRGLETSIKQVAGQPYRGYSSAAAMVSVGGPVSLSGQYAKAKGANPNIKTVIMTGGINDFLIGGGSASSVRDGLRALWTLMASEGVRDVIYVEYAADSWRGIPNGASYQYQFVQACRAMTSLRCHPLATDALVQKGELTDGVNPSPAATDRIAGAVLTLMREQGIRR